MLRRHIWPNVTAPLIVQASLNIAGAILSEASLSFLGMGAPPPTPSWGAMLKNGYGYLEQAPWTSFFPGAAIFITVLGLNFLGDGLRIGPGPPSVAAREGLGGFQKDNCPGLRTAFCVMCTV